MTIIIPTYPGASLVLYAKIVVTVALIGLLAYGIKKYVSLPKAGSPAENPKQA